MNKEKMDALVTEQLAQKAVKKEEKTGDTLPNVTNWVKLGEWEYKQDKSGRWRERATGKNIPGVYINKARISELGLDDAKKLIELTAETAAEEQVGQLEEKLTTEHAEATAREKAEVATAEQEMDYTKESTPEEKVAQETAVAEKVSAETDAQKELFEKITENARILQNAITTLEKMLAIAKEEGHPKKDIKRIQADIENLTAKSDALIGDQDIETMLGEKTAAGESIEELSDTIKQLAEMAEASATEEEKYLVDEPVSAEAQQVAAERVAAGEVRSKNVFQELSDKMNNLQGTLVETQKQLAIKKAEAGLWKRWFNKEARAEIAQLADQVVNLQTQMQKLSEEIGARDIGEVVGERAIAQEQAEKESQATYEEAEASIEAKKAPAERIAEVTSFEELLAVLEKTGMTKYEGRIKDAEKYSLGLDLNITEKTPLVRNITRENGLRAKVVELINKNSAMEKAA